MRYIIKLDQQKVGNVTFVKEGLYDALYAQCRIPDGIFRLYMETENRFESLGVLAPESGSFTLRKRYPSGKYPLDENAEFFVSQTDPWQIYHGKIQNIPLKENISVMTDGCFRFCEILEPDKPLALLPYFCLCRPYLLYGRQALLLELANESIKNACAEF